MNNRINKWTSKLNPLATLAIYIVAIFGLLNLTSNLFNWVYDTIKLKNVLGVARIICEPYLFPLDSSKTVPPHKLTLIIGVSIEAKKNLTEVRVSFKYLDWIVGWAMKSNAISPLEQKEFLSKLPVGELTSFITPPLPKLSPDTTTTIEAITTLSADEFDLHPDLINVTSNEGKIYHTDIIHRNIRGLGIYLSFEEWFLVTLVLSLILFIFKALRKRKLIKIRKTIERYPI